MTTYTGGSGESSPIVGIYPADTSAPAPSTDFQFSEAPGLQSAGAPNELALLKFQFTKPTTVAHIVSEASVASSQPLLERILRVTGTEGDTVTITYNDSGATPVTYQWEVTLSAGSGADLGYLVVIISDSNLISESATPSGPSDYSALDIASFTGSSALTDLAGFRLYRSESVMTLGSFGTEIQEYLYEDAQVTGDDTGILSDIGGVVTFQFAAPDEFYDGRELYFALTHIDNTFPTPNESLPDIGVFGITLPGQPSITSWSLDVTDPNNPVMTINLDKITDYYNPHLKEMMGTDVDPTKVYSERGGIDIYRTVLTALDFTDGVYDGIDADTGQVIDTQITSGSIVTVIDAGLRQAWQVLATEDGRVSITDDDLITGSRTGLSYSTNRSTQNFAVYQGTINTATDSILPLSSDPTPVKQYLTDKNQYFEDENVTRGVIYGYTAQAVDTELEYGKA